MKHRSSLTAEVNLDSTFVGESGRGSSPYHLKRIQESELMEWKSQCGAGVNFFVSEGRANGSHGN